MNMGLSCVDVENFQFHAVIEISRVIDNAIANHIPSDLVSMCSFNN